MSKRHLKITGLGLIKRDTILLTKRYYLKLIETILNKEYNNLGDYVLDIIKDLR